MHSTKNKDDGYLGSGKIVLQAIKKYGRENFKKEILAICESRSQLAALEKTIISESLLKDPLCMNLKVGGEGGGLAGSGCGMPIGYKHSHVTKQKISIAGRGRVFGPLSEKRKLQISENRRGHKHTDVSKKAISEASIKTHSEIWDVAHQGKTFRVVNLKDFCIQNNLKYTTMILSSKKQKPTRSGWIVSKARV